MEERKHISQYRKRLEKTLAAHELTDLEALKKLVRGQIVRSLKSDLEGSIETIVEKRSEEVFNCVQMLKSTSEYDDADQNKVTNQKGWKLKQDSEEYRVMYREGPEGTPFHSLLVEGYVDGPLDVCLCIAWESILYRKWWPQSNIPTFKILSSECLQKVRDGEQICLVRAKLSWPLSTREVIVHFFEFEYFQDDLIVVLFNSISDSESVDRSFYGFSKDAIPDKKDFIRIDLLGGMAMQKVSATRSYFRTIANMDIKLDFLPPSVINFISRQLIGRGFVLYKKEVASVSRGDEDFRKALDDPLLCRIREALYSENKQPPNLHSEITINISSEIEVFVGPKTTTEIEEIVEPNVEEIRELENNENKFFVPARDNKDKEDEKSSSNSNKRKVSISPQVKQALETLDKAILLFRENKKSDSHKLRSSNPSRKRTVEESKPSEKGLKVNDLSEALKDKNMERASNELRISFGSRSSRRMGLNMYVREANHSNKIVPASPQANNVHTSDAQKISLNDAFSFHKTGVETTIIYDNNNEANGKQHTNASLANGNHNITKIKEKKHKRLRKFCCFRVSSKKF